MKVLIAGGSGFIGSHLTVGLVRDGHEVVVLTRGQQDERAGVRYVRWDANSPDGAWATELSGSDSVINLAGSSVGSGRWTRQRMAKLVASRVTPTATVLLKLALGQQSELLLDGRRAVPEKVQAAGYQFRFGGLPEALEDLLRRH
jgi:NAD dependent epimerase/dehydratase family enzyme